MQDITTKLELDKLLKQPVAVLKFSAVWCGPCKAIAPYFNKLDEEFTQIRTGGVDLDKAKDIAQQFQVTSVPQFIFFKDGKMVDTVKGGDRAALRAGFERLSATRFQMPKSGGHSLKQPTITSTAANAGSTLYKWAALYLRTLFSFDARRAAEA